MASVKFTTNLVFASLVVILALAALSGMYFQDSIAIHSPVANPDASGSSSQPAPAAESARRLAELEQLAAQHPENAGYQTQLANIHYDEGRYDKALDHYQLSLNIRPQDPYVETDLATCYHYLGQSNKSLELLNKVIKSNPDFSPAKFNKGVVLIHGMKDIKNGISVWKELLVSDPDYSNKVGLKQRILQVEKNAAE